jgi:hypothetical protein
MKEIKRNEILFLQNTYLHKAYPLCYIQNNDLRTLGIKIFKLQKYICIVVLIITSFYLEI